MTHDLDSSRGPVSQTGQILFGTSRSRSSCRLISLASALGKEATDLRSIASMSRICLRSDSKMSTILWPTLPLIYGLPLDI